MYECHKVPFGKWEQLIIQDKQSGNAFSLVPAMGANLLNLQFQNQSVLDGFDTAEALNNGDWAKSALLFPFPNRLKDGVYQYQGKTYQFPITDTNRHHAIHGLVQQKAFNVNKLDLRTDGATISCLHENQGDDPAYPFPFTILIEFSINNHKEFEVNFVITNNATQAIPVGLGWHPYFRLTDFVNQSSMQLPTCKRIEVDDRMIPTGVKIKYTDFLQQRKLEEIVLDTCFELENKTGRASILLESEKAHIEYWQDASIWSFFQIFTPPDRKSIAIEPMSCNIDAFNNKDGLTNLPPGHQFGGKFGLHFSIKA